MASGDHLPEVDWEPVTRATSQKQTKKRTPQTKGKQKASDRARVEETLE